MLCTLVFSQLSPFRSSDHTERFSVNPVLFHIIFYLIISGIFFLAQSTWQTLQLILWVLTEPRCWCSPDEACAAWTSQSMSLRDQRRWCCCDVIALQLRAVSQSIFSIHEMAWSGPSWLSGLRIKVFSSGGQGLSPGWNIFECSLINSRFFSHSWCSFVWFRRQSSV